MIKRMQLLRRGGRLGLIIAFATLGAAAAFAGDAPSKKLAKQISLFEQTTYQMLAESEHFMVSGPNSTAGLYLPGYGVVMTFHASLVGNDFTFNFGDFWEKFHIEHEDGKVIVHIEDWDDEEKERVKADLKAAAEDAKRAAKDAQRAVEDWKSELEENRKEMEAERLELLEEGKEEMVDLLLDYGETLLRLRDSERVMVAAFLNSANYWGWGDWGDRDKGGARKLIVSASMADIRAYAQGDIGEETMRNRIEILEY